MPSHLFLATIFALLRGGRCGMLPRRHFTTAGAIARSGQAVMLFDAPSDAWAANAWTPAKLQRRLKNFPIVWVSNQSRFTYYERDARMTEHLEAARSWSTPYHDYPGKYRPMQLWFV